VCSERRAVLGRRKVLIGPLEIDLFSYGSCVDLCSDPSFFVCIYLCSYGSPRPLYLGSAPIFVGDVPPSDLAENPHAQLARQVHFGYIYFRVGPFTSRFVFLEI
jgi:hypothetical protein